MSSSASSWTLFSALWRRIRGTRSAIVRPGTFQCSIERCGTSIEVPV
jgi:hypothetical protein